MTVYLLNFITHDGTVLVDVYATPAAAATAHEAACARWPRWAQYFETESRACNATGDLPAGWVPS